VCGDGGVDGSLRRGRKGCTNLEYRSKRCFKLIELVIPTGQGPTGEPMVKSVE
jgi:hypothetical protein